MQAYTIHIDGLAYQGEAPDQEYNPGHGGEIGQVFNQGNLNDLIIAEGDPIQIGGWINLRSHIDRIFRRMRAGRIKARKIVIEITDA